MLQHASCVNCQLRKHSNIFSFYEIKVSLTYLDLGARRTGCGGVLEREREYEFRRFSGGSGRLRLRIGDGDLGKLGSLLRFRGGGSGDWLLRWGGGVIERDLERFLRAPLNCCFLRSFSRISRSNSFRGSSIALGKYLHIINT
jgi:hypothetical protein